MLSNAVSVETLPSRLHTTILLIYLLTNVIYCTYLDYGRPTATLLAELRGRTRLLSIVSMIPLIILAARNNPFNYLLEINFDTYNIFHRWLGRVIITSAIIHTIAWAFNEYAAKGHRGIHDGLKSSPFLVYDLLKTIASSVILMQSPSIVYHAFYETFLHIHQSLALAVIMGVWIHYLLGKSTALSYIHWVLALWLLDRLARLFHILYRNISSRGTTKVTIEALPSDTGLEACRVSFELARPWKYTPSCHAYVYLPSLSFWMSHPFSIAWSTSRPILYLAREEEKLRSSKSGLDDLTAERKTMSNYLVMAKRTGMTAKLYNRARASLTGVIIMWGLVEGSYGGFRSFHFYGTVILFAVGVDITYQIGYVRDLL